TTTAGPVLTRTFTVALVPGANVFEVKAANGDGSWDSESARLRLHLEKPLAKPTLFVLAVGINVYAQDSLNLKYAAPDAQAIADLFRSRGQALYDRVETTLLLDDRATRKALKEALTAIARKGRPADTLVVFLAGHGAVVGQRYY